MKEIKFQNGKYNGYSNGQLVVSSTSKYYVQKKLDSVVADTVVESAVEFDINERFGFVTDLVTMVASGATPSTIISGEGGLGKTYTVTQALRAAGLKDITEVPVGDKVPARSTYRVIKGFSTAKGLYRILAENANSILVFDDCDSILKDDNALNILKSALDTFDKRIITWNTSRDEDDVPRFFEFKGGIVFISNLPLAKIEQAIRSRAMCVDLSMTTNQKIERMKVIMQSAEFMPEVREAVKLQALALVDELKNKSREVSLRTLIKTTKIASTGGANWKKLAEYMLIQG